MSPVLPEKLQRKKLTEIEKIKVQSGNEKIAIGSLFAIAGNLKDSTVTIKKSNTKLDFIGHGMTTGKINIFGSVGDYLGRNMTGGNIVISGNAGQWAGASMNNGCIEIKGNVGDYLSAVIPGEQYGMKGGFIHIHGNAGSRVAEHMRRGLIAIEGNAGDYCGCNMLAGTILVLGKAGKQTGFSMKRGSIILTQKPKSVPTTFNRCGILELGFLKLIFNELGTMNQRFRSLNKIQPTAERIAGDLAVAGKGELLILCQPS